ncbi:hypothetical protein [Oleispirillum naphthae]|uniref:hypothetical protein n=1 Tax=Oleispirillum naphthae TaxID=2838853 RepID=UPI00308247FC
MTIDATQTQGLTRSLTRDTLNLGPQGKVELKKSAHDEDKDKTGASGGSSFSLFGDDGLSFWDVLDVFNPLQHIPVVNSIYRELTGDTIKPGIKLIGGTLFGGPVGLAAASVDVAVEGFTGKDLGGNALAMIEGEPDEKGAAYAALSVSIEPSDPNAAELEAAAAAARDYLQKSASASPTETAAATAQAAAEPARLARAEPAAKEPAALPPWSPAAQTAAAVQSAPGVSAKSFAPPKRRNAYADSPKPLSELRADTVGRAALTSSAAELPPGLSEAAMRAAGLTPDMVRDVIAVHSNAEAATTAATAKETAGIGSANTPAGTENMWFYSAMNQALDKYGAAKTLSPAAEIPEIAATDTGSGR